VVAPETAGGGGAKKTARRDGVPMQWRSFAGRGGHRRVLQLEEGCGRRGVVQKGQTMGAWWSPPRGGGRWRIGGSLVGRHGHKAEEERRGDGVLKRVLAREDERERIEGCGGNATGSAGRVTGGATRRRDVGAWGQRCGQAVRRGWQRPDRGTRGRCTCERRTTGSETGAGGG
jgi:hypothetical protein